MFDARGKCLEMPFEDKVNPQAGYRNKVRTKAYRVEGKAGMLWAYMGPEPAPLIPDYDFFHEQGFNVLAFIRLNCNWFQCQENAIDPVHTEWLHTWWEPARSGMDARALVPTHLKIACEEHEHGFRWRRFVEGMAEDDPTWVVGRWTLWPNVFHPANVGTSSAVYSVPIDDEHTLQVYRVCFLGPAVDQQTIPYYHAPYIDPSEKPWAHDFQQNQDAHCLTGQGTVVDRTREHLGESDRGVIMLRKCFFEQMKVVASGGEPKAIIRDSSVNNKIALPISHSLGYPMRRMANANAKSPPKETKLFEKRVVSFLPYGVPEKLLKEIEQFYALGPPSSYRKDTTG